MKKKQMLRIPVSIGKFALAGCLLIAGTALQSCRELLEPPPVDLLVDDLVLKGPDDIEPVRLGLYNAMRGFASPTIIAADFTPDYIQHNGTFTDYNELGNKNITPANGVAASLWGGIYSTVYVANFIEENIEAVGKVPRSTKDALLAEARFCRGYAYFIAAYTFGDVPNVTSTNVQDNRDIPRAPQAEILDRVLEDYNRALEFLPDAWDANSAAVNKQYATKNAARAALARYYLYKKDWAKAEEMAGNVINIGRQRLDTSYVTVISTEFDSETILEMAYANNSSDDPGTSSEGLNNLFVGRREVIPDNRFVLQINGINAGTRKETVNFSSSRQQGTDNGWMVTKYGTPDQANNNITLFRLAEMYLIRAEARAQQGRITGASGALGDVNILRARAKAPSAAFTTQANALSVIEQERLYELAFEGHRWFDLKRTGRIQAVMSAFSPNWNQKYELWPVPQGEIQRNPALKGAQNQGY